MLRAAATLLLLSVELERYAPAETALQPRVQPAHHALVLVAQQLWSWGEGGCGQLGIGRVTKRDRPVLVQERADDGSRYVDVVCGWAHAIGLTESQAVYTWGFNTMGQLGVGDLAARHTPTRVKELDPAVSEAKREVRLSMGAVSNTHKRYHHRVLCPAPTTQELDAERKRVLSRGSSVTSARAFHPDTPYGQDKNSNPATGRPVEVHTLSPAQFLDHTVTHSLSITQRWVWCATGAATTSLMC